MKKQLLLLPGHFILIFILKKRSFPAFISNNNHRCTFLISDDRNFAYFNRQKFLNFSHFLAFVLLLTFAFGVASAAPMNVATPTITESGAPGALTTTYGTASASSNFSVSGSNMLQGILVTPPAGLVVSTDNTNFFATVTVGSAGTIPPTTVYVRLSATTAAGSYSGNIVLTSQGATNVNVFMPASTVSPAPLTISPNDVSKTYGTTLNTVNGSTAFTSTGLVNGETIGSVTISYGSGSAGTDPVGTYGSVISASNPGGGTFDPANYTINYTYGQITVNPAPLSIIADNVTKIYGQTLTGGPGSKAFTAVGLQNGETIGSVTIDYGSGAAATYGVGTYVDCVSVSQGTGGNFSGHNYTIPHVSANIIIVPAPLSITADDVTKSYGQILTGGPGSAAFTVTGLKNGETVGSVTIDYGTGGQASYPPGPCDQCVVPSNATGGSFDPNNYTITYIPGNINVEQAPLTITADNQLKLYGEPNPVLTVTYTGFVNGDGPAQMTTLPAVTTTATTISPPGQYPITPAGASAPNYVITYVPGELTITDSFGIPNAFTPNGDGINDTWHIQFLDSYQNCTVNIFNRTGQSVYNSNGYAAPWDGTLRGTALPAGTYYYVINLKTINKVLSGYVALIR